MLQPIQPKGTFEDMKHDQTYYVSRSATNDDPRQIKVSVGRGDSLSDH